MSPALIRLCMSVNHLSVKRVMQNVCLYTCVLVSVISYCQHTVQHYVCASSAIDNVQRLLIVTISPRLILYTCIVCPENVKRFILKY